MEKEKRKIRVSFNSPAVLGFTIICFAALVLNWLTRGWTNDMFFSVYHSSLANPLTYVRFIGHIFGHAGWEHYADSGNRTFAGRKIWYC